MLNFSLFFSLMLSVVFTANAAEPPTENKELEINVASSSNAAKTWLNLIDNVEYDESWNATSSITQNRISKKSWVTILNKTRKPLGLVKTRNVLDQRTAKDPKNMPKGDYMVFFYNTSFTNKANAYELLTLYLEPDHQWKVVTYQVD